MMLFNLWFQAGMLTYEAGEVVGLRISRLSSGGHSAIEEGALMVREKMEAACTSGWDLATGGSALSVVERYRGQVAANAERLKIGPEESLRL